MNRVVEVRSNEEVQRPSDDLRENEEIFSKAFHGTVAAQAISRFTNGTFIDANDRWLNLFDMKRDEVIGRTSLELNIWVDPEDRKEFIERLEESGFFNEKEMEFRKKYGDFWTALMSAQVLELGGEKVILSSLIDITQRKRAEQALEESEAKFRSLTDASPAAVFVYRGHRFLFVNPAATSISGYAEEELLAMDFLEIIHPESRAMVREGIKMRMAGKSGPARYQVRIITKAGEDRWLDISTSLITYEGLRATIVIGIDITESKRNEEKFSRAFHGSAAATYITRLSDGEMIDANDQGLKMLGYNKDELLGRTTLELNIWLSNQDRQNVVNELKQKGSISNRELQLRRKGGQIWTALHSSQIIELDGEAVMLSSLVDITDRKKMEEELRKSEEKFAKAFNGNAANMLLARADDGRIIDVNDAMLEATGYSREEIIGKSTLQLGIWKHPEQRDQFIRDLRKYGSVRNRECEFTGKNGRKGVTLMSGQLMTLGGDELMLSSSTDITDRKKMEEALFNSQQMLQLVLDSVPNRVFWKDLNLNYLGCNKKAARDAGLMDPSDIVGKNDYELAWRDSAPSYRADDRQVMESGVSKINYEEKQEQSDGSILWLKTSKVPLRDHDGEVIGLLGTYEDITEQKRMEEEIRRSNEELQQFAYVASHDLQEPLRVISSYLDLLEKRYKGNVLDERGEQFIHMARDGAGRMQGMINDLLAYSRIETRGKSFSPVDMNEALSIAIEDLKASIGDGNGTVTHESLPIVKADQTQMVVLLENLIGNAIKFHGQEAPRVHISSRPQGAEWVISVRDNGIGIAREQQERIFEMFQRLHTREEYEGTGIGLAVAKKIVERHGGRIWVESEEGEGSTFYFAIPKRR